MIAACRTKGSVFPHALLVGPPGIGRTSLAHIIARELGVSLHTANAEDVDRAPDLAAIVNNLVEGDVLLLEDFERLRRPVAQRLESAMRDFEFHIVVGEGMGARTMKLAVNPFTLLGSVTRDGECDRRLQRAFDMVLNFKPYSTEEMHQIVRRLVSQLGGVTFEAETMAAIAHASDGNPGKALNFVKQLVAHSVSNRPTHAEASEVLHLLGVQVGSGEWPGGAAAELANLSPIDFEHLIADLLRRMGFGAKTTRATGDGGIDVEAVLEKPIVGGRYLFQCKRYGPDNPVGSAAVREFYGALHADRRAVKGVFITTSTFTPQAREFAQDLAIELIDGERLRMLFEEVPSPSS